MTLEEQFNKLKKELESIEGADPETRKRRHEVAEKLTMVYIKILEALNNEHK